jgi:hypothetical protein
LGERFVFACFFRRGRPELRAGSFRRSSYFITPASCRRLAFVAAIVARDVCARLSMGAFAFVSALPLIRHPEGRKSG